MYILISLPNKFITENLRTMIDKKNPPRLLRVIKLQTMRFSYKTKATKNHQGS